MRPVTTSNKGPEYFHSWFFPNEPVTPPFRTFFKPASGGFLSADAQTVIDGHVVYLTDQAIAQKFGLEEVKTDLKWTQTAQDRILSRLFLKQIQLQAMAEAIAVGTSNIEWAFSVPTSFSPRQREFASNVWANLADNGPMPIESTESIATAAYFLDHRQAPIAAGTICVDVGGMSSDVAIWQENRIQLQTSLRLASRAILVDTLEALPSLQRTLFGMQERLTQVVIETWLMRESEQLWTRVVAHENDPGMNLVRQSIVIGIGGVLFYAGLLLRYLAEEGRYVPRLPSVYVGGNGARMLHWLADGRFRPTSQAVHAFEHLMRTATGFEEGNFRMEVTPDSEMKHEVGYGLVVPHNLDAGVETTVIAGEAFSVNGKQHSWNSKLSEDMLQKGVSIPFRMEMIRAFYQAIDSYARGRNSIMAPIIVEDRDFDSVAQNVIQVASLYKGKDLKDIDAEPLFATALKTLLGVVREKTIQASEVSP